MICSTHKASLDNVFWERDVVSGEDLLERLRHAEIIMRQAQEMPLCLLIIDSIAHLFRDVGDKPDVAAFAQRTGMLFRISSMLRRFADDYNLAVVITNQVSICCYLFEPALARMYIVLGCLCLHVCLFACNQVARITNAELGLYLVATCMCR